MQNIYLPWRVRLVTYRAYQQIRYILSNLVTRRGKSQISFYPNYHQTTGSTVAIASIANRLSKSYCVDALITPQSAYSRQLYLSVKHRFHKDGLRGDIVFVDIEQDSDKLQEMLQKNKYVIVSCHAFPEILHAVPQEKLKENLRLATSIHFVSEYQLREFEKAYPELSIAPKSFVIPNYTRQSSKTGFTGNIGIVGHTCRPAKNAAQAVSLGMKSTANSIQCWGSRSIYNLDKPEEIPKLKLNGWSNSVEEIHASFDVLISTSQFETFGLVVSEALSAGIPCVLADIPVFRSLYSECEGVALLTGDQDKDVETINFMLENAKRLQPTIAQFWRERFSSEPIRDQWKNKISEISYSKCS